MDRSELESQIAKYKSRRLKTRLANYSTFISIFLALSTFSNGYHLSSLFSLLLLLPLLAYFALQSLKLTRKTQALKTRMVYLRQMISGLTPPKFSFRQFLTQPNLAFRLSCILFFLVLFTTLARTSSAEALGEGGSAPYHLATTN